MFKAVVVILAVYSGHAGPVVMVGHEVYSDKVACETALNGDEHTKGSAKKLVVDLKVQGIDATVLETQCVPADKVGGTGP